MKRGWIKIIICAMLSLVLLAQLLPETSAVNVDKTMQTRLAVDPVHESDSYSAVLYNNTNGLPTSETNAIAETDDGFIWIGSYSGLIRYDGQTFERMDSTTGITSVVCLFVDSADRLWIGTNDSGVALMEDGEFRIWSTEEGMPSNKTSDIVEDENGLIYVSTSSGIVTIDDALEVHPLDDPRLNGVYVEYLCAGSDGLIYGLTNSDDLFALRDGAVAGFLDHETSRVKGILRIFPDPKKPGNLYLGTEDSLFYYGDPSTNFESLKIYDISPLTNVMEIRQFGNQIWIGGRNGIGVLENGTFTMLDTLPINNSVGQVMRDYEGNLWFTSTRQGVMKLVSNRFSDIFEKYDLPGTVVNSTCVDGERLYVATDTGLIVLEEDGPVTSIPLSRAVTASGVDLGETDLLSLLDGCRIRSAIRDSQGRIWFSTWRACGLVCYDGEGVTVYTVEDGLISDHLRAVRERPDGSVLVVNSGGVSVIENGRVTRSYSKPDGIVNPESLTVEYADNGDILLGSDGGGIYVINGQETRCIGTGDGLSSGIVMRIKRDEKRNLFWIVTSNSIAYMTPDYQVTTIRKFPYSNNFDLYENSKGDMWILSSNGIYVTPVADLLKNGDIQPVHYGMNDGMPCISTGNSYCELTESGNLYIAGSTGVAKVNIETPMESVVHLKVAVPYIEADGVRIYPDENGNFAVSSKVQKLTVYSHVFNFSLTDLQVTYALEGFDREPVTVRRSALAPVDYTNLPGGTYHFVMHLKDSLGRGDKTLSVMIVKEKAITERTWFFVIINLVALLLLVLGVRYYLRRKTRAMERRHRQAVERERLVTELSMAARIQHGMLPHVFPPFPERREFDIYASMDPARQVGGDFYDFFLIDEDHLCMVMADVSGKGIPAALFMMVSKSLIKSSARMGHSASEVLRQTNETICSNNQMEMFVTVWIGILEISTGKITAANAGHEYPSLMKDGRFELLKDKHGLVIGGMEGVRYKEYEILLKPGDKIFLYTDGVPEATDAENHMFGTERMLDALNAEPAASPEQTLHNVRSAVDDFVQNAEQFDDLTMLCLEYHGPSESCICAGSD